MRGNEIAATPRSAVTSSCLEEGLLPQVGVVQMVRRILASTYASELSEWMAARPPRAAALLGLPKWRRGEDCCVESCCRGEFRGMLHRCS